MFSSRCSRIASESFAQGGIPEWHLLLIESALFEVGDHAYNRHRVFRQATEENPLADWVLAGKMLSCQTLIDDRDVRLSNVV